MNCKKHVDYISKTFSHISKVVCNKEIIVNTKTWREAERKTEKAGQAGANPYLGGK